MPGGCIRWMKCLETGDRGYIVAIPLALFSIPLADAMFVLVALMWFVPDRRIEQALGI
jgi:hypothetical protein